MDERTRSDSASRKGGSSSGAGSGSSRRETDSLGQLKEIAKEKGLELRDRAAGVVEQRASERLGRAADGLSSLVDALRSAGDALGGRGSSRLSDYPIEMAGRVERLADHLRESEPRELAREIEDLARRYPEIFLGGMLVAGLAAGRFLRASREQLSEVGDTAPETALAARPAAKPRKKRSSAASADAPNYSGSRDYDEAEDGESSKVRARGSADPGAGANYAAERDYSDAGVDAKRKSGKPRRAASTSKSGGNRSRVPAKADPMPGGGRTTR